MGIALYAVTIFLSAFLLFQVQPVIARMILPWFGGSASVWTTCMLFFQSVLLLGYLYVHWGVRRLAGRGQALLHMALLLASLATLPVNPGAQWKPQGGENPSAAILLLLAACVGAPYFLLSTTSPLLQFWYAGSGKGMLPYRLFALSNFGSLLALISYPALVEPFLATRLQGIVWSGGYVLFVALCLAAAARSVRGSSLRPVAAAGEALESHSTLEDAGPPPSAGRRILWVALAACPSALLLAVTNHLTGDVAAIPFLWIVPLTLYLLSFIFCFDADGWYIRPLYMPMLIPALGGMSYLLYIGTEDQSLKLLLAIFCAAFFICCMVCHGEMVKSKPHPRHLTSFYLMLAIGGALGGLFVGLLAPYCFSGLFEFPIAIVSCGALAVWVLLHDPRSRLHYPKAPLWITIPLLLALATLAAYNIATLRRLTESYKLSVRNFYGTLRVRESGAPGQTDQFRTLLHGAINHGEQWIHPSRRREPLSYYCPASGVGLAIRTRQMGKPQRVGVFGLGAGTIAAYARPGDFYRFYEINPLVVELARGEFFYLRESPAPVEIVLGDARLSLEREPNQEYDVLAVDCFSGDSIPVHLITREALNLYFRHLRPDGILAMHTSNRYLDLEPVLERIATSLGKATLQVATEEDDDGNCFGSVWVLLASRPEVFAHKVFGGAGSPVKPRRDLRVWTDDYSSLLRVVK